MSKPGPTNNKRWWLWWPLLASLAWLVIREQGKPSDAGGPSLPTRTLPSPSFNAHPPVPQSETNALTLVPREQLLGVSNTKNTGAQRDLFIARSGPTPTAQAVAVVAAPSTPALPFRYVGKQWDGQVWEVYAVSNDQTYVLREGTTLDDQYRVERIAPPHATLTYLPLGTTQTLLIGDTR